MQGNWKIRRRFMFAVIAFCMAVIVYCLLKDMDSVTAQTAVQMSFFIIGSTVASYVFGATWETVSKNVDSKNHRSGPGGE